MIKARFIKIFALLVISICILCSCSEQEQNQDLLLIQKARQSYTNGFFEDSMQFYQQYLQLEQKTEYRWEAWRHILDISMYINIDYDLSLTLLDTMLLEYNSDFDKQMFLLDKKAELYFSINVYNKAIEVINKKIELLPTNSTQRAKAFITIANAYRREKNYDLAMDAMENCVKSTTSSEQKASCKYEKAQLLTYMEHWQDAELILNEILEHEEISVLLKSLVIFSLADIQENRGEFKKAEKLFLSIKETYPNPQVVKKRLEHIQQAKKQRQ